MLVCVVYIGPVNTFEAVTVIKGYTIQYILYVIYAQCNTNTIKLEELHASL